MTHLNSQKIDVVESNAQFCYFNFKANCCCPYNVFCNLFLIVMKVVLCRELRGINILSSSCCVFLFPITRIPHPRLFMLDGCFVFIYSMIKHKFVSSVRESPFRLLVVIKFPCISLPNHSDFLIHVLGDIPIIILCLMVVFFPKIQDQT